MRFKQRWQQTRYIYSLSLKRLLLDIIVFFLDNEIKKKIYDNYVYLVTDNEITPDEKASFTTSCERDETSGGSWGNDHKKGADGGARPKEMPDKRILAIKLKTKKNKQSAVSEIRSENIGVAPKKKNITLNVSEKVRI